jgi:hypothetical protein
MGSETGLHHSQIARIWNAHGIKPRPLEFFNSRRIPISWTSCGTGSASM